MTDTVLAPEVNDLAYFGLTPAKIGSAPVTISRTGYSGDLGFEVFVAADDALGVLDKVIQAGEGQGFRPFGEDALNMVRIEAGLSLIGVEFSSARYAFTDAERFTPQELGFGWMLGKGGANLGEGRPFIGRRAIERELREGTSRWATVGLWVDWQEFEQVHLDRGLVVPKDENPAPWDDMLVHAITLAMAAKMAYGITQSASMRDSLLAEYERHIKLARAVDGQDDTPDMLGDTPLLNARFGARSWR